MTHRAHRSHILFEDAEPAFVSLLPQPGQELRAAIGIAFQQTRDHRLERIELARPLPSLPGNELFRPRIFGHRFRIDPQLGCNLTEGESHLPMPVPDLAVGLVIDHEASIIERRTSPMLRSSPPRGSGGLVSAVSGSRLKTW